RIVFRILAEDEVAAANAFSRQPSLHVHGSSQRRGGLAGSRPADHLVVGEKGEGRATGSRKTQGALGDELQNCIRVGTGIGIGFANVDFADFTANHFQTWRRGKPRLYTRERFSLIGDRDDRTRLPHWQLMGRQRLGRILFLAARALLGSSRVVG